MTAEQLAESIKADIIDLVKTGVLPNDVPDFATLHNYVDANVLGATEQIFAQIVTESETDAEHVEKLNTVNAIANPAMDIVNDWIKAGNLTQCLDNAKRLA